MDDALNRKVRTALEHSWSSATSDCFNSDACPSYGQCAQTAIVVQDFFGGTILRTTGWHARGNHFYNCIDGTRVDFTADQFEMPGYSYALKYEDHPSSAGEALKETKLVQVEALRQAFRQALGENL